jgi:KDO2-lipid IV(A) lauroyltransferase
VSGQGEATGRSPKRAANRARRRARRRIGRQWIFRGARALIRWLPLPVASVLGQGLGLLVWWAVPWMRRQTLRNLEIAFGAEKDAAERRRIARRCYVLAGRGMFAWMVLHRMGRDRALARLTAELSPEAKAAFGSGKGAVLLTQHSGLFELSGAWIAREYAAMAVGREGEDAGTSMLIAMRTDMGLRTIEQGSPREIVRTLRDGGIVAMLADQDIRGVNGAFVPFFGRLAHTPIGPAAFAVRMKVPIVCAHTEWRSLTTHAGVASDVLFPREDLPPDEAVLELTARTQVAIERAIRERPDEWLWMHERWRTTPAKRPEAPVWPRDAAAVAGGSVAGPAGPGAASAPGAPPGPGGEPRPSATPPRASATQPGPGGEPGSGATPAGPGVASSGGPGRGAA